LIFPTSYARRGKADAPSVGKEVNVMAGQKIGRNARNGQFIPVKVAQQQKSTSVVETIKPTKGN